MRSPTLPWEGVHVAGRITATTRTPCHARQTDSFNWDTNRLETCFLRDAGLMLGRGVQWFFGLRTEEDSSTDDDSPRAPEVTTMQAPLVLTQSVA